MSDYASIVRKGIATARDITISLHVDVTWQAWTGQTFDGVPTYSTKTVKALAERKHQRIRTKEGVEVDSMAYIAILEELTPPSSTETRNNPVDTRDVFTLPDGTSGPILRVDGFFDGGTSVPYYSQVYLG